MSQESRNQLDEAQQTKSPLSSDMEDESIDVYTLWTTLRKGKRTILIASITGALLALVIAAFIPNSYTATASFITPRSTSSGMSAVSAQLAMMGAGSLANSFKNPGDMYIGILQSKTVARDMVAHFNLMHIYKEKKESAAEKALAEQTSFNSGLKDDIITISVTNHDPKLAQDMANAYLDELHSANGRLALTEASQRRLFFEQQVGEEKDALENAETALQKTQERTGLIAPMPQTSLELQTMAQTQENIAAREVELSGMLQGSTEQDPNVIRLRSQIAHLKGQLATMINGNENDHTTISASKVPALQLEYARKQREVNYHESLLEILIKQYEAARLDESHDAPILQVIDRATLPDAKSSPHRSLFLLGGLLAGFLGSSLWVLFHMRFVSLLHTLQGA